MYKDAELEVVVHMYKGMPFIHCKATSIHYKKFVKVWDTIQQQLREQGHSTVFSCIPEGDSKLYKFQTLFGMTEAVRSEGQILFSKEL